METEKKKKIEAQLRLLLQKAKQTQKEERAIERRPAAGTRVIRRRKGQPDTQIA
jgi:regulator of sirC expression with transglutaminase-like and TPR domain